MLSTLLIASIASIALADGPPPPPVVGGSTTSDHAAVGALVALDAHGGIVGSFCSGTLIDRAMVLTAAHCIDGLVQIQDMGFRDFEFVIGYDIHTSQGTWERLPMTGWFQHPDWDMAGIEHDVALVSLERESEVALPALLNRGIPDAQWPDEEITYVGWGKADDSSADTAGVKRTVDVPFYELHQFVVLTHDSESQNVCYGDSGGGAFLTDGDGAMRLAGVNSFIFSLDGNDPLCESPQAAAGAARVDAYLSWIGTYVDIDAVEDEVTAALEEPEEIEAEEEEPETEGTIQEPQQEMPDFTTTEHVPREEASGCAVAAASPHLGLSLLALLGLARRRR